MRDQCAVIFRQAKKELESLGLLKNEKEINQAANASGEDALASDIDKELEQLQVCKV